MPTCQKKDQLCRCIDWPDEDFDVEIDHFIRNFEFLHVELEYASLDAREPVRVCRIGRCRVCGGRMCDGTTLPPEKTVRELMPTICILAGLAFQQFGYPLPAGTEQLSGSVSDAVSRGGPSLCKAMALGAQKAGILWSCAAATEAGVRRDEEKEDHLF